MGLEHIREQMQSDADAASCHDTLQEEIDSPARVQFPHGQEQGSDERERVKEEIAVGTDPEQRDVKVGEPEKERDADSRSDRC